MNYSNTNNTPVQAKVNNCKGVDKMNELQIFKNEQFGEIRTITKNNEIMFVAADVCKILEIKNPTQAVERLDDDEKAMLNIGLRGGATNVVNEYGLYSLVLSSRKPEAKAFKRWITHEVIPAIRKTGGYTAGFSDEVQEKRAEAMLLNARTRQSKAWMNISDKTNVPEYKRICQQKAAGALAGVPCLPMEEAKERTYSATDIGKILGVSANKIGLIANKYNLKTPQYGKYFYSKSEHSCKEVETFRYYECAVAKFREILEGGAVA